MTDLLLDGFTITAIGMGVVFALLTLLVGVIRGMSVVAIALGGEPVSATASHTGPATNNDDEVMPVIAVAIRAYRRLRNP